jgi:hypothetical protein
MPKVCEELNWIATSIKKDGIFLVVFSYTRSAFTVETLKIHIKSTQ